MHTPNIICIAGPTASGKTAAALHAVQVLQSHGLRAAVVNADSRQVYRDFPIITAQPTPEEKAVCPHLLYGWLSSEARICAGEWADMARNTINELLHSSTIPLVVGGTGFYMRSLFDGIADIPAPDPDIRSRILEELRVEGAPALHARLSAVDPEYAAKIHPNDSQRCCRALEVWESTGRPFSWWHAQTPPPPNYSVLRLGVGLPLNELEPILARRIDLMLQRGAIEEARKALSLCPDTTTPGWTGIGCAEIAAYLNGSRSLDECRSLWIHNTRAYAKRQWTWFKADGRIAWHRPEESGILAQRILDFLHVRQ